VIAGAGLLLASKLGSNTDGQASAGAHPGLTQSASPRVTTSAPANILAGAQLHSVRIIDPSGHGKERANVSKVNDGDEKTYWKSDWYLSPDFGNEKPGMGLLIDLGSVRNVASVSVDFLIPGETAEAMTGTSDPGATSPTDANDAKLLAQFKPASTADPVQAGSSQVFPIGQNTRYVLIWVTSLPLGGKYSSRANSFLFGINEVSVQTQ